MVLCSACRPRRHISRRTCVQQTIPPDTEEVGVFVYRNQRHCGDCGIMCLYMRFTPFTLNHCFCCKGKHIFRKTQRFYVVFSKTMQIPFKIGMKRNCIEYLATKKSGFGRIQPPPPLRARICSPG